MTSIKLRSLESTFSIIWLLVLSSLLNISCLSFKGVTIPESVTTYNVLPFDDRAGSPISNLGIDFTIQLRDQIRENSRLLLAENNPDVQFEGSITKFKVNQTAPDANNQVAFNQLVIGIKVQYSSAKDPDAGFDKTFEQNAQFPASSLLIDQKDVLIPEIFEQLTEQVFNEAFTNW